MPIELRLPQIAEEMTSARIAVWLKKDGEQVNAGDIIAEVETDKTNVELEAPATGLLTISVLAGASAAVGEVLAVIRELPKGDGGAVTEARKPEPPPSQAAPTSTGKSPASKPAQMAKPAQVSKPAHVKPVPIAPPPETPSADIPATALAVRMAKLAGIDLASIRASAPDGRINKTDVEKALGHQAADPPRQARTWRKQALSPSPAPDEIRASSTSAPFEDRPHSAMRRVTADRLQLAKQTIPHFYLETDCSADALLNLRSQVNGSQFTVTVTDLLVFIASRALRKVRAANSTWTDTGVRVYNRVDIAVAVNTPKGLITPIVRGCDDKTLAVIARELKALVERARAGQLTPDEYSGGTFTLSNLGMFGVSRITPIINPPQSCILGVGAIEMRPIVREGNLAVGKVITCTLAADHRVIDGATAAELLAEIRRLIEEPMSLVLVA